MYRTTIKYRTTITYRTTIAVASVLLISSILSGCSKQAAQAGGENTTEAATISENQMTEPTLSNDVQVRNDMQKRASDTSKLLTLKGRVLFQQMEGGFFGFIDENGNKYTPIGMNKVHQRHGLVIKLSGRIVPDMITTTQFGEVIKVESVVIMDESNALDAGSPVITDKDL